MQLLISRSLSTFTVTLFIGAWVGVAGYASVGACPRAELANPRPECPAASAKSIAAAIVVIKSAMKREGALINSSSKDSTTMHVAQELSEVGRSTHRAMLLRFTVNPLTGLSSAPPCCRYRTGYRLEVLATYPGGVETKICRHELAVLLACRKRRNSVCPIITRDHEVGTLT
jgi:hypothetical protein